MNSLEEVVFDCDDFQLHGIWMRSESPRAIVKTPGFTEFLGSQAPLARAFQRDYNVFIVTVNCHGESTGTFDFLKMCKAMSNVYEQVHDKGFDFVGGLGVSLGGMVAGYTTATTQHLDALCLLATGGGFPDYYNMRLAKLGLKIGDPWNYYFMQSVNWLLKATGQKGWSTQGPVIYDKKEKCYRLGSCRVKTITELGQGVVNAPLLRDVAQNIPSRIPVYVMIGGDDQALKLQSHAKPGTNRIPVHYEGKTHYVYVPPAMQQLHAHLGVSQEDGNLLILPGFDHSLNPLGTTRRTSRLLDPRHNPNVDWFYLRIKEFFDCAAPISQSGIVSGIYQNSKRLLALTDVD